MENKPKITFLTSEDITQHKVDSIERYAYQLSRTIAKPDEIEIKRRSELRQELRDVCSFLFLYGRNLTHLLTYQSYRSRYEIDRRRK
jgi:hypothetical protein